MKWKTLLTQITIWLALEVLLTAIGLDDIADYSEFLIHRTSGFYSHVQRVVT